MAPTEGNEETGVLLADIPKSANALGSATAPVTLQYFGDLECPFCRDFTLELLPSIVERWVRAGDLRIEYHALETATREPEVFVAQQVAALAAGKQDRAWHFIESFYREQGEEGSGYVTDGFLQGLASEVPGLNLSEWNRDRGDPQLAGEIAADARAAQSAGLGGTPSFLIGRSADAITTFASTDATSTDAAIEGLLKTPRRTEPRPDGRPGR
jgi:protein-disulfide isomerase